MNPLKPDKGEPTVRFKLILDEIMSLSSNAGLVFNWSNRKANSCAHWLASKSRCGLSVLYFPM